MMGLNMPIPVALQVADYLEANAEAAYEREGVPLDRLPRAALHSVTLKTIHSLGESLKAIIE
eukprot:6532106-Alexandrium_andersonii.AAC.1